ncbi:MAG: cyclic nucleotide-binding domain-containing protein [Myxococcaceae bacterium]|nr:cyclic nucleotide-binding domain-containing protein [Myxococcaceae bacterium]MCI0670279.1 cyclic nucleotide-binding domain-containing protein [Myxococcaceae bacterium]
MRPPAGEFEVFLEGVPVFGGLPAATVARLAALLDPQRFGPGQTVCAEGEHGRLLYVVLEGELLVSRRGPSGERVRLARMGVGDCFGEMTLVDPQSRSATVTALRPCVLLALSARDLYRLYCEDLDGYVLVLHNLCRELSRRLRLADERICQLVDAGSHLTSALRHQGGQRAP